MEPTPDRPGSPDRAEDASTSTTGAQTTGAQTTGSHSAPEYGYDAAPEPGAPTDERPTESPAESPAMGLPTSTTPRAVLRPVPDGFPTPPPRPAKPNRRPALPPQEPEQPRPRGLMIVALATVAVLVLSVGIGGSILVYRALAPEETSPAVSDPAATDPAGSTDGGAAGEVEIGAVTVREVSTELGVASVGRPPIEADGEFVILTIEFVNDSDLALLVSDSVTLETSEQESYSPSREASNAHLADTEAFGVVTENSTESIHMVFDVSIGAEPVAAHVDLSSNTQAGTGTLPLGG